MVGLKFLDRKLKFAVGDHVDFDTREDHRYDYCCWRCAEKLRIRKCVVTKVQVLGYYDLMQVDADPRISAGHHSVSERCLTLTLNPHID